MADITSNGRSDNSISAMLDSFTHSDRNSHLSDRILGCFTAMNEKKSMDGEDVGGSVVKE